MRHLPTDLQILDAIYDRYYPEFAAYTDEKPNRSSKIYVPIDVAAIAKDLKVDGDIVFGRLYYHLDQRHGYKDADGSRVPFFTLRAGSDTHCVHFPLASSVLADLRLQSRKYRLATTMSVVSFAISVTSFLISVLK